MGFAWQAYSRKGKVIEDLSEKIRAVQETGDPEELAPKMQSDLQAMESERTFNGILMTFLGAGFAGIFFVLTLLPFFAQMLSQGMIGSNEKVEKDILYSARSLVARGDYAGAIAAFQEAAAADPLNRMPWVEIAKLHKGNLQDPQAAIQTIRHALESQAWEVDDAAYFLFRLAELYEEVDSSRESAVAIMNQVIEQFPNTRHSANAAHKLHEWGRMEESASVLPGEEEYLARLRQSEEKPGGGS